MQVITWGSITGTVRLNGAPVPHAHVFVYLPGGDAITADDGTYTLSDIPIGSYALKAQYVIVTDGVGVGVDNGLGGQPVTLTAENPNVVQDINLQGLSQGYRRLDLQYSITCGHWDTNPAVHIAQFTENQGPFNFSIDVNPGNIVGSHTYTYDYAGGGYFQISYEFDISLLADFSISVTVTAAMRNAGPAPMPIIEQYTEGPVYIGMDASRSGEIDMKYEVWGVYTNGPSTFTWKVTNNQQTGA